MLAIPQKERGKLIKKLEEQATNPHFCKRLTNWEHPSKKYDIYYKLRQGNYRLVYIVEDDKMVIVAVKAGDRKDIYAT